jgi:hypothetical protein
MLGILGILVMSVVGLGIGFLILWLLSLTITYDKEKFK